MESSTEIFEVTILETQKINFYNFQGKSLESCDFGDAKGSYPLAGETIAKISLSDYYSILEKSKKMLKRVKELSPKYWVHIIPYHDGKSFVPIVHPGKYKALYFNGKLVLQHPKNVNVEPHFTGEINILETDTYLGKTIARISEREFVELKRMTNFQIGCISKFRPRSLHRDESEFWIPVVTDGKICKGKYQFKMYDNHVLLCGFMGNVDDKSEHIVVSVEDEGFCTPHIFRCNVELKILFCEKCGSMKWVSKY